MPSLKQRLTTRPGPKRPPTTPSQEPASAEKSFARSAAEFALVILIAIGLAIAIQAWVVKPYRIPSGSMEPTLTIGQRILVDRIGMHFSSPHVGDIMVFHPPADYSTCADPNQGENTPGINDGQACDVPHHRESSQTFVKRLVGLPGDRLKIIDGHVIRNGKREPDAYTIPCNGQSYCNFPQTIVVPKGYYYMMGDNRAYSEDSRFWGPVPRAWLIGKVFFTYWPINRIGFL